MGNRARYVLMLVFLIPSKSLKNEIFVAVGECMEHRLTPTLWPKALPISQTPHEIPLKATFSNTFGNHPTVRIGCFTVLLKTLWGESDVDPQKFKGVIGIS